MTQELATSVYHQLVSDITELYSDARRRSKQAINEILTKTYWEIGKHIVVIEQKNRLRAEYGAQFLERLSDDLTGKCGSGFSATNLKYMRQFYVSYPNRQAPDELAWTHYQVLSLIEDDSQRQLYERKVAKNDWSTRQLRAALRQDKVETRRFTAPKESRPEKEKPPIGGRLNLKRGRLYTYAAVGSAQVPRIGGHMLVDLGFSIWRSLSVDHDIVEMTKDTPQFTYKAYVERVIDGDTLWCQIETGFGNFTRQKLRLRGIDTPELVTLKGSQAKSFVQKTLSKCDFIIVKTHKSDKYDRYLADIFYMSGENDAGVVAQEGMFLNQELLDKGFANLWCT